MALFNLAFGIKIPMVNKGGLVFQSADKHEGKPVPFINHDEGNSNNMTTAAVANTTTQQQQ